MEGVREARPEQLAGHVNPWHRLDRILQIAFVVNKYPTLFILKVLEDGG